MIGAIIHKHNKYTNNDHNNDHTNSNNNDTTHIDTNNNNTKNCFIAVTTTMLATLINNNWGLLLDPQAK